ncbi:MAG: VOC family protein, partial [Mesorhizobium sp.]
MTGFVGHRRVVTVALVVRNYEEAISWYVGKLGFLLIEDVDLGGGKRWVTVAPADGQGARLLLAEAAD